MMRFLLFLVVTFLAMAGYETACGQGITLDWSASASAAVIGYNVYYGTNSGNYPYKVNAGNSTTVTISNLIPGLTYYFSATAYNGAGAESALSGELNYLVPGVLQLVQNANNGAVNPGSLQFPVAPGHWYEVQASADLQNWTSIYQTEVMAANIWQKFTDHKAASFAQRFYRLVLH